MHAFKLHDAATCVTRMHARPLSLTRGRAEKPIDSLVKLAKDLVASLSLLGLPSMFGTEPRLNLPASILLSLPWNCVGEKMQTAATLPNSMLLLGLHRLACLAGLSAFLLFVLRFTQGSW